MAVTPRLGLTKPTVGGSADVWGTQLNTNFDLIDAGVSGVTDVSNTYTAAGTIALTDNLSLINSASAVAITIPTGGTAASQLQIHNYGSGVATVSGTIEGAFNSVILQGNPAAASVTLWWLPSKSSWIVI